MKGRPGSRSNGVGRVGGVDMIVCPRCNGEGQVLSEEITIGDRLRGCRGAAKKTQDDMAPLLGVTRAQLANLESDRSGPSIETLMKAAKAYHVSVDYLVGLKP